MAGAAARSRTPGESELVEGGGWRCPEHGDRVAELFCSRCRRCVCALCPVLGAHRGHPVGLALDAAVHVQKLSQECLKHLAIKKQQHADNITQIEDATEKLKANAESSKTWLKGKFTELRLLLDEEEALAKKFIDKNTQLTLQVYREQADSCREQLDVMNDLSSRVWSIGQEPDPVQRLQMNCQLSDPSSTKPGTLLKTSPSPERSLFLKYARTPTLDPDTMHARLRLSADRLTVRCGLLGSLGPVPALRFDALWQVLARDCFAAGRHYWEVDVQEAGAGWWVGAAYASLRRRGASAAARLGCNRQSWCLKRYDLEYWAFHDGQRSRLRPRDDLDRLGVFLDYEAGVLAFYDVTGGMSHLHTFRSTFQEPLYPALRLWEGAISIPRLP
uniref:Tripartite motif containing 14 n=1 Tax=Nomascus leucogenys TaxID=61853 RepID=G1S4Z5_NOMLE